MNGPSAQPSHQPPHHPPMNGFGRTLAGSIVLHALAIAAAAFLFASGAKRVFITPVYTVDLVSNGPRQAVMAPPAPPAPPVEKAPEPAPEPVKAAVEKAPAEKAAPAPDTVKIKQKPSVDEALKKIEKKVEKRNDEALVASSIDSLKKKMETERSSRNDKVARLKDEIRSRSSSANAPQTPRPALNQASGAGAVKASLETKYPAYYGLIRDKVQDNWIYPEGLKDNKISVIVSIKIARSGKLLDVSVEKSSGDHAFDSSLLKAVKKAAPFPPLPVNMEGSFLETGLRFCPGCAQ